MKIGNHWPKTGDLDSMILSSLLINIQQISEKNLLAIFSNLHSYLQVYATIFSYASAIGALTLKLLAGRA
jgi:hypothetical protein